MRTPFAILATAAIILSAAPVLAQTATEQAASPRPAVRPLGPYDQLAESDKRIVSAIYEAQLGSANDTNAGALLSRDEIAGLREKNGWSNAYNKLHTTGMVTEKTLNQALSIYNHSIQANRHITVINTGGGEQLAFSKDKSDNAPTAKPAASNGATAKPVVPKPATVKPAASSNPDAAAISKTSGAAAQPAAAGVSPGNATINDKGQTGGVILK